MARTPEAGSSAEKTARLNLSVWYKPETGHIHLALPETDWFITTVNDEETSKRGHPHLYRKLARALKEAGLPGPDFDNDR